MTDTLPADLGNEDPNPSTAPEGMNEPDDTPAEQPKLVPVELVRPSKHRAGRMPKMTKEQIRKRNRVIRIATQARKKIYLEHQKDLRALLAAMSDD